VNSEEGSGCGHEDLHFCSFRVNLETKFVVTKLIVTWRYPPTNGEYLLLLNCFFRLAAQCQRPAREHAKPLVNIVKQFTDEAQLPHWTSAEMLLGLARFQST